jgi:hypothetical protein
MGDGKEKKDGPGSPDVVRLLGKLRDEPLYMGLPSPEVQELAEQVVVLRWEGKGYMGIAIKLGYPPHSQEFDQAWRATGFVEADMRAAGREAPYRPDPERQRRYRERREGERRAWKDQDRDLIVMKMWEKEGRCALCGRPRDHEHPTPSPSRWMTFSPMTTPCPVCGKDLSKGGALGGNGRIYCPAHVPHMLDDRWKKVEEELERDRREIEELGKERKKATAVEERREEGEEEDEEDEMQREAEVVDHRRGRRWDEEA